MDGITDSTDMTLSKLWEIVKGREAWCAAVHRVLKSQTWLVVFKGGSAGEILQRGVFPPQRGQYSLQGAVTFVEFTV